MSDNEKSAWDDIPSLNLTMDEDYSQNTKEDRKSSRSDFSALKEVLNSELSVLPIKIASSAHGVFDGQILDISKTGCRVMALKNLRQGEPTKVRFIIEHRSITTKAIVRWVSPNDNGCNAGLEFRELSKNDEEFLGGLCSATMLNKVGRLP